MRNAVYPRWRGEHCSCKNNNFHIPGLSPLTRGTCYAGPGERRYIRFIPAGAGNTNNRRSQLSAETVYPRWRGEHMGRVQRSHFCIGLSPLARGPHGACASLAFLHRFIPAGAGNTNNRRSQLSAETVYPRWRGEHMGRVHRSHFCIGLSPLARGTRVALGEAVSPLRFIPAGAGNTNNRRSQRSAETVYPRWRGEHMGRVHRSHFCIGLSPLARGTRVALGEAVIPLRFIPAGAGNTFVELINTW